MTGLTLMVLTMVACGAPAPTPVAIFVTATSQPTPQPTPTPVLPTEIPTPAIPIPDGLLPSTLTPAFFDSLYQKAISKASSDIPTATLAEILVKVYPFGSESWPGITIFLRFKMGGDLYSYQWDNETNDLAYQGKTHYFVIGSGEGTCSILSWQRKSGWEELVRFGYFTIHKSFPIDVKSHYLLDAMAWERECSWQAYFWHDTEHLGNFVLNESGPSGQ